MDNPNPNPNPNPSPNQVGVTLLIMESGMHINFEKVKVIGGKAFVVAIIGTAAPMVMGMLLVAALFPGKLYPEGFAAGCALAPTSVGISIKLLSDAKMLNSMAGQTTLTGTLCHTLLAPKTRADPTDSWGSLLTQPTDQPTDPACYPGLLLTRPALALHGQLPSSTTSSLWCCSC